MNTTNIVTVETEKGIVTLDFCQDRLLRWYLDGKEVEVGSFESVFDAFLGLSQFQMLTPADEQLVADACGMDEDGGCPDRFVIFTADPDHKANRRVYTDEQEAAKAVEDSFRAGKVGFDMWGTDDFRETAIGISGDPADAPHGSMIRI